MLIFYFVFEKYFIFIIIRMLVFVFKFYRKGFENYSKDIKI